MVVFAFGALDKMLVGVVGVGSQDWVYMPLGVVVEIEAEASVWA